MPREFIRRFAAPGCNGPRGTTALTEPRCDVHSRTGGPSNRSRLRRFRRSDLARQYGPPTSPLRSETARLPRAARRARTESVRRPRTPGGGLPGAQVRPHCYAGQPIVGRVDPLAWRPSIPALAGPSAPAQRRSLPRGPARPSETHFPAPAPTRKKRRVATSERGPEPQRAVLLPGVGVQELPLMPPTDREPGRRRGPCAPLFREALLTPAAQLWTRRRWAARSPPRRKRRMDSEPASRSNTAVELLRRPARAYFPPLGRAATRRPRAPPPWSRLTARL
jgi:hypothetical protein